MIQTNSSIDLIRFNSLDSDSSGCLKKLYLIVSIISQMTSYKIKTNQFFGIPEEIISDY